MIRNASRSKEVLIDRFTSARPSVDNNNTTRHGLQFVRLCSMTIVSSKEEKKKKNEYVVKYAEIDVIVFDRDDAPASIETTSRP